MKLSFSAVLFAAMAVTNVAAAPVAADNGVQAKVRRDTGGHEDPNHGFPPSGGTHGEWCSPGNPNPDCGGAKVRRHDNSDVPGETEDPFSGGGCYPPYC
ncbi:unnamed protein product [Zymoseptoria tritici ST99CH_3D7]|uniref:Uncharacterized protein n=1 Tax=Zymoseptoria tritici (strain ST99CH_3D7) TaxID=1276538 RepID=A0A1X7RX34_ZYMT9|nr:unnamed protein product [Zymoseptoria tritici ST99CH_3D7]